MDKLDSTFEKRTALTAADTTILMIANLVEQVTRFNKFCDDKKDADLGATTASYDKEHSVNHTYPKTDHKSGNWWPSRKYPPTAVKITFE